MNRLLVCDIDRYVLDNQGILNALYKIFILNPRTTTVYIFNVIFQCTAFAAKRVSEEKFTHKVIEFGKWIVAAEEAIVSQNIFLERFKHSIVTGECFQQATRKLYEMGFYTVRLFAKLV